MRPGRSASRCCGGGWEGFPEEVTGASSSRARTRPSYPFPGSLRAAGRAPPASAKPQRRRPAPPQPGVAKPALLPRDGEEARAGAGKEHASKCPRGKEDQGTLLNPAFDFKNLPCPLPSATLCFLAFLSGRFFTSTPSHFFPFYACSHIYHSG